MHHQIDFESNLNEDELLSVKLNSTKLNNTQSVHTIYILFTLHKCRNLHTNWISTRVPILSTDRNHISLHQIGISFLEKQSILREILKYRYYPVGLGIMASVKKTVTTESIKFNWMTNQSFRFVSSRLFIYGIIPSPINLPNYPIFGNKKRKVENAHICKFRTFW